ncbi:MAG: VTT domain-containing protein [Acidobacteriota bacterium]|nr:VTT domain-containing protein [Acidobacteriota bacterium]
MEHVGGGPVVELDTAQTPTGPIEGRADARVLVRGLALLVSMILVAYVIRSSRLDSVLDEAWLDTEIRGQGLRGELTFIGLAVVLAAVGLPRQVVSFTAGYAFGFSVGLVLALTATVSTCVLTFTYARFLGRALVARRFPDRVRRLDAFLMDKQFVMMLLIRFFPVGSNLATNLAAGVSGVRAAPFVAASAIGYLPQTAVFALLGSGIEVDPVVRTGLSIVLFAVSGVLGLYLYRRR